MAKEGRETAGSETEIVPVEVRELLEQRSTYRAWLGKLGGLREKYRPDVARRVEQDYRERLERIDEELEAHRGGLETALDRRRGAAAELGEERDARAAELEEAELRFAVGEFGDEEWERRREEKASGLTELEERIAAEEDAVAGLERTLAEIAGEAPEEPVGAEAAPDGRAPAGEERTPAAGAEPAREPAAARHAATGPDEDGAAERPGGDDEEDVRDELEFLESLTLDDPDRFDSVSRMLDPEKREGEKRRRGS